MRPVWRRRVVLVAATDVGRLLRRTDDAGEGAEVNVAAGDDGNYLTTAGLARERGRRRAAGGAFGDHVDALGHRLDRLPYLVERDDERSGQPLGEQRPHPRDHRLAAGAIDE